MLEYTTKMEINVLRGRNIDIRDISTFVIKNKIPAIICEPEYIDILILDRNKYQGAYKIICAVDFWDGNNYAMEKIKYLPQSVMVADGFEILATPNRSDKETFNELKTITEFIRGTLDAIKEIRWALALRTRPPGHFYNILKNVKKWPGSFIRTDVNIESPAASVDVHGADFQFVRDKIATPVKVSGNVTFDTMMALMGSVARFDVSLAQAKRIMNSIRVMERQEKELLQFNEEDIGDDQVIYAEPNEEYEEE